MALYHRNIGWPGDVRWPEGRYRLVYTRHARTEAAVDKYRPIQLPPTIELYGIGRIVEAEIREDGTVTKLVARVPYDVWHDLALVLVPGKEYNVFVVKTVWLNERNDTHRSLDARRYTRP